MWKVISATVIGNWCCSRQRVPFPFHPNPCSYLCSLFYDGNCSVVAMNPYPVISTTVQVFFMYLTLMQGAKIAVM